jgi:hypothetical protein
MCRTSGSSGNLNDETPDEELDEDEEEEEAKKKGPKQPITKTGEKNTKFAFLKKVSFNINIE